MLLKLILCSTLLPFGFFGILLMVMYIVPSFLGFLLGIVLSTFFLLSVICFGYPVFFRDYIKSFWEAKEK